MSADDFPKRPEKRRYQRIDLELPVTLEYNGEEVKTSTQNISCGGMFLPSSEHHFKEDDRVIAFLSLPNNPKTVRLNGRVVRTQQPAGQDADGVAVEFNGLYDENLFEVDRFVKKNSLN